MIKWLWLALIPSLLFAEGPDSLTSESSPIYIDVGSGEITIYPDQVIVAAHDIAKQDGIFNQLLNQAESDSKWRHIILFLRPGSVNLHRHMRQMIQAHNLNIGFEPWEKNRDFLRDIHLLYLSNYPTWSIEYWDPHVMEMERNIRTKGKPCEIEVYADYLIILKNNTVVKKYELQTEGNAFDQWLDQCGNTIQCWYKFCKQPGSEKLYSILQDKIYERGKQSGAYIKSFSTPLEVSANGRTPIYLLCQSNQLFEVTAVDQPEPADISELLTSDPKTQYICFLVRPDSFNIFRRARKEAWLHGIDISCELQDESGPLAIGVDGSPLFPEKALKYN